MEKLLKILSENARISNQQLAVMLNMSEAEVKAKIAECEEAGILQGYKAVVDWEKVDKEYLTAFIEIKVTPKRDWGFDEIANMIANFEEVESVYLMSGGYDLFVTVSGRSFKDVALFVAKRLSPMDSVLSTATHFILHKYKEKNIMMGTSPKDEREVTTL